MNACADGCVLLSKSGVAMAVFVMVVRWMLIGAIFLKISKRYHQSFSPTLVGERRLFLAMSLRSNAVRWHDAAMIDLLRLSSK